MGDDLACEVAARALAAAGVGRLRLIRATGPLPNEVVAAMMSSSPDLKLESGEWPRAGQGIPAGSEEGQSLGRAWLRAMDGASLLIRSGFDDDPMLRAAVRLGVPVVVMRGREEGIDVLSFRRHGPCPHAPLDVPEQRGVPPQDGAEAVVAAHLAAAEVLVLLAGATTGQARARQVSIPAPVTAAAGADSGGGAGGAVRAADLPWTPECFACGGSGGEMSFS